MAQSIHGEWISDLRGEQEEERYGFSERSWRWLQTSQDFRTHYVYEIGFLALPGMFEKLSDAALEGAYYFCYLFGGVLFMASSILYILKNQPTWYTPQRFQIGWHVGVFNLIGATGWPLAAASIGYCKPEWCEYQSELTLVGASAAFSIGSAIQWYDSLDKYVVVFEDWTCNLHSGNIDDLLAKYALSSTSSHGRSRIKFWLACRLLATNREFVPSPQWDGRSALPSITY